MSRNVSGGKTHAKVPSCRLRHGLVGVVWREEEVRLGAGGPRVEDGTECIPWDVEGHADEASVVEGAQELLRPSEAVELVKDGDFAPCRLGEFFSRNFDDHRDLVFFIEALQLPMHIRETDGMGIYVTTFKVYKHAISFYTIHFSQVKSFCQLSMPLS